MLVANITPPLMIFSPVYILRLSASSLTGVKKTQNSFIRSSFAPLCISCSFSFLRIKISSKKNLNLSRDAACHKPPSARELETDSVTFGWSQVHGSVTVRRCSRASRDVPGMSRAVSPCPVSL